MIGSLARHTLSAATMFCAATFVVLAAGLAYLWISGRMNDEKAHQILGVVYGVDLAAIEAKYAPSQKPVESEQPAFDDVIEKRLEKSLDFDLRETSMDKALIELRTLEDDLRSQRERFDARLREFEKRISDLQQETLDEGLANVQLKLEAIQPKQAKDLILKMIAEPAGENDDSLDAAVTILKNMSVEKSRKIIAEFKTPEEVEQLHKILGRIRLGQPISDMLSEVRQETGPQRSQQ
jgi:hypothetical protein